VRVLRTSCARSLRASRRALTNASELSPVTSSHRPSTS
jgi:hypothetical protein